MLSAGAISGERFTKTIWIIIGYRRGRSRLLSNQRKFREARMSVISYLNKPVKHCWHLSLLSRFISWESDDYETTI